MAKHWLILFLFVVGAGCTAEAEDLAMESTRALAYPPSPQTFAAAHRTVFVYPFTASYEPGVGLTFQYDEGYNWSAPLHAPSVSSSGPEPGGILKDELGAFGWERITVHRAAANSLWLTTSAIESTPSGCGLPAVFPYNDSGAFCFDARVDANQVMGLEQLYAEITSIDPSAGYNGYAYPLGTGADPAEVQPACNLSDTFEPSNLLGLWEYGGWAGGSGLIGVKQWVFENDSLPFSFRGRFVGFAAEQCGDSMDNNCDGYINEGCSEGECCLEMGPLGTLSECSHRVGCPFGEDCVSQRCTFTLGENLGICVPNNAAIPECIP